jgi:hypothetical protein
MNLFQKRLRVNKKKVGQLKARASVRIYQKEMQKNQSNDERLKPVKQFVGMKDSLRNVE